MSRAVHTFNPSTQHRKQRQVDLSAFEASLIYRRSSRSARAKQRDPVSWKEKIKKSYVVSDGFLTWWNCNKTYRVVGWPWHYIGCERTWFLDMADLPGLYDLKLSWSQYIKSGTRRQQRATPCDSSTKTKLHLKIAHPWGSPPTGEWRQGSQTTDSKNPLQVGELMKGRSGFQKTGVGLGSWEVRSRIKGPCHQIGGIQSGVCAAGDGKAPYRWHAVAPEILDMPCMYLGHSIIVKKENGV